MSRTELSSTGRGGIAPLFPRRKRARNAVPSVRLERVEIGFNSGERDGQRETFSLLGFCYLRKMNGSLDPVCVHAISGLPGWPSSEQIEVSFRLRERNLWHTEVAFLHTQTQPQWTPLLWHQTTHAIESFWWWNLSENNKSFPATLSASVREDEMFFELDVNSFCLII